VFTLSALNGKDNGPRSCSQGGVSKEYRRLLISEGMEQKETRGLGGEGKKVSTRKGII
jgi:hypothetical protein